MHDRRSVIPIDTTANSTTPSPKQLYHYTNLSSLALILANRTIRLMPLTGMDDPQENETADVANLGRFFFASCWTDEATESIPMWNMYASLDSGVRIALPPMPFRRYEYTTAEWAQIVGVPEDHVTSETGVMRTFMPVEHFRDGMFSIAFLDGHNVLQKVTYTDDQSKLHPKVLDVSEKQVSLALDKIGRYKNTYWQFQREWRYLMCIVPLDVLGSTMRDPVAEFNTMVLKMIQGNLSPACNYYDLHLSDEAMSGIGITPSPKMSAGNRELLKCLLEKHGLSQNLCTSQLEGML